MNSTLTALALSVVALTPVAAALGLLVVEGRRPT